MNKSGAGVEITEEALVMLLGQRFPNLLDWERAAPRVHLDPLRQMLTVYFLTDEPEEMPGPEDPVFLFPFRNIGEGASIPTQRIDTWSLGEGGEFSRPRCGMLDATPGALRPQCLEGLGHEMPHRFRNEHL